MNYKKHSTNKDRLVSLGKHLIDLDMNNIANWDQLLNVPHVVYFTNTDENILEVNDAQAAIYGIMSPKEMIGKTFARYLEATGYHNIQQNNLRVMNQQSLCMFEEEVHDLRNHIRHLFLSFKFPLYNLEKKVIGSYGLSVDMIDKKLDNVATILNLLTIQDQSLQSEQIKKILSISEIEGITLSGQETKCLYCLARGLTMKEIGAILKLAPKTVEGYLVNIKIKLRCSTRGELIRKALNSGYPYTHHFPIFQK